MPPQNGYVPPRGTEYSAPSSAPWAQTTQNGYARPGYPPYGYAQPDSEAGKPQAVASLVLGLVSLLMLVGGYLSLVSILLGIIGLVLAHQARSRGYRGGVRTAGFVLSLLGLIGGVLVLVSVAFLMLLLVGHL